MNTHDIELPPLPEPTWVDGEPYWYDRHMEAYARAAIEADRKQRSNTKPSTNQDWLSLDPAVAFHLIERHAENWNDAGAMMQAYLDAHIEADRKRTADLLKNPIHVHVNMCRGIIAPITFDQLAHVLGDEATEAWLADRQRRGEPVAWQPIETAPHEVEVLLGWREWDGKWKTEVSPDSWGWNNKTASNISGHGQATHWMPLPPAPQPAEPVKRKRPYAQGSALGEFGVIPMCDQVDDEPVKVPSEQATPEEIAALKNDLREYMLAANAEASEVDRLNRHLQEALAHLRTIASFGGTVEQARKLAMAGLDRAGTPTPAQSNPEPRLYQHTDGRYGLSFGPAKFAQGEPAWYAVPIDVYDDDGR